MIIIRKTKKVKILVIFTIIITSAILLPWLIKFPYFVFLDFSTAPSTWFNYGIVRSWGNILTNSEHLKVFIFFQLLVSALALLVLWDTRAIKKKINCSRE